MKQNLETGEILRHLGLSELNDIQQAMVDAGSSASRQADTVLLSPTGSGKTLAYLIPLVQNLQPDMEGVQAVVLVPSRELALQTADVFKRMGTDYRIVCCYGGRPAMEEHRTLRGVQPQVVVATPGRMNDHLAKGNIDAEDVHTLVIDEFDKCLELGFQDEMSEVLRQLPHVERRILLSATDAEAIPQFVGLNARSVQRLDFLGSAQPVSERISLHVLQSPEKDKLLTLYKLLCTLGAQSSLVFVNYREAVERVGKYLLDSGIACEMFHGGMEQPDRERALYKFTNGSCNVFVSTDLASRGLDIPDIDNIIHYHLPTNQEAYIHRNGRTARWEAEGNSYLILGPEEKMPEYIDKAEPFQLPASIPHPAQSDWVTLYIGKGKKDKVNKVDIVGFLCQKGKLQKEDLGRIDVKDHYAFAAIRRSCIKQALRLVQNEKIKGIKTIITEAK